MDIYFIKSTLFKRKIEFRWLRKPVVRFRHRINNRPSVFFTVLANRHGTTVSVNIAYFESARPSTRHSVHGSHRRLFNEPVQAQHGRLDKHWQFVSYLIWTYMHKSLSQLFFRSGFSALSLYIERSSSYVTVKLSFQKRINRSNSCLLFFF